MTVLILAVAGLAVINFVFKAIGPALLGGRTLPPRGQSIVTALPPALLAALLLADLVGEHWSGTAPTVLPDWPPPSAYACAAGPTLRASPSRSPPPSPSARSPDVCSNRRSSASWGLCRP